MSKPFVALKQAGYPDDGPALKLDAWFHEEEGASGFPSLCGMLDDP
ncbi:MAG: hypothetical protein H6727_18725 [Myxococcales bacterium]|nr:hypothetical protein [Myxococcales bacterium]